MLYQNICGMETHTHTHRYRYNIQICIYAYKLLCIDMYIKDLRNIFVTVHIKTADWDDVCELLGW